MLKTKQERARLEAKQVLLQIPGKKEELKRLIGILEEDAARAEKYSNPNFSMNLWNEEFTKRREAGERLIELLAEHAFIRSEKLIGRYRGFDVCFANDASGARRVILLKGKGSYQSELSDSAVGIVTRIDNVISGLAARLDGTRSELERLTSEEKELALEAERESELDEVIIGLRRELHEVNRQLGMI